MTALDQGRAIGPGRLRAHTSLDRMAYDAGNEWWWLSEAETFDRKSFFFSEPIDVALASNGHTFLDDSFRCSRTAGIQALHSERLSLVGGDGIALYDGNPVYDTLFDLAPWEEHSNISGFELGVSADFASPVGIRHLSGGPYFLGFNGRFTNYCHWIQQMNPWHFAFVNLRKRFSGLKLVLPPFKDGLFRYQTLSLLGITEDDIVIVRDKEALSFESAILCGRFDLWAVPSYSLRAARALSEAVDDGYPEWPAAERIFLHRRVNRRTFVNFENFRPLLEARGFTILEFENVSVRNQIRAFRNARYIMAEHGAGMINLMFCRPGARVLELFNPACVQPAFWSVASVSGVDYGYAVGQHVPTAAFREPGWNSSYSISPERFEAAIEALLAA
ncbi:MAG: glycosyltransferase family 61 protein [Rhodospirillales bacterium]|mgnify:CR=1 FL=1|nr:glycosyltransferase family 61 protein [Rhodospirillales bacterium]MBN8929730.1 glycosyltransferase family 61 protein [Rhodospirillales bacterium]